MLSELLILWKREVLEERVVLENSWKNVALSLGDWDDGG